MCRNSGLVHENESGEIIGTELQVTNSYKRVATGTFRFTLLILNIVVKFFRFYLSFFTKPRKLYYNSKLYYKQCKKTKSHLNGRDDALHRTRYQKQIAVTLSVLLRF